MKFENLMYDGKNIKIIVDLEDVFIENNKDTDYYNDNFNTLDLTNLRLDIQIDKGDSNVK